MKQVIVEYRVSEGNEDENRAAVERVFDALSETRPPGLQYACLVSDDGRTFVHVASLPDGENPLLSLPAFKEFQSGLKQRCAEPPVATDVAVVGAYQMFEDRR